MKGPSALRALGGLSRTLRRARSSPRALRLLLNLYPPYLGAGIRVLEIAPDWGRIRVRMDLRWFNKNYVGTHFGGSLYSMTDPFLMLMFFRCLGPDYVVWDQAAAIRFLRPGRGAVYATFELSEADLAAARAATAEGERYRPSFEVPVLDEAGETVALVEKTIYVRRKPAR